MNLRKTVILLTIILASVVGLALSPESNPSPPISLQADIHLANKEYNSAILRYKEALSLEPDQLEVRQKLIEAYILKRKLEDARAVLEDWIMRSPADPKPHVLLGTISLLRGREEEAASQFREALSLDPRHKEARHDLANLYLSQGQFDRARIELEVLVIQDDSDRLAHLRLGEILATEEPANAIPHLRQAMDGEAAPQTADEAKQLLETLVDGQREEDRAYAVASLGFTLLKLKQVTLAQRQFAEASRLAPQYADAQAYLGYTWLLLRRPDNAGDCLQRAAELNPASAFAHHILGNALRAQGRFEEAADEQLKAESLDHNDPFLISDIALTYLAANDLSNAEAYYIKATEIAEADPTFVEQLAMFYLNNGFRLDKGLTAARRVAALLPGNPEALDLLGWAFYLNELHQEAENALGEALKADPYLARAHYHLALVLEKSGEIDRAKREYERTAELDLTGYYERRALAAIEDLSRKD